MELTVHKAPFRVSTICAACGSKFHATEDCDEDEIVELMNDSNVADGVTKPLPFDKEIGE